MANRAKSILDHEKTDKPVAEKRSPIDRELFGELSGHALGFPVSEETLYSSIAEYLAAKGIGFALAVIRDEDSSIELKALFAPNGTNHTPHVCSNRSKLQPLPPISFTPSLMEDLENTGVLLLSSIGEVVIDGGEFLRQAFSNNPIMVTRLPERQGSKEILILCGRELDDPWRSKAKNLARKLSSALDIARMRASLDREDSHHDWLFSYSSEGHLLIEASGEIREVNQIATELLGQSPEELIGKNIADVIPGSKDLVDTSQSGAQESPSVIEVDYQVDEEVFRYLHVEYHPFGGDEQSKALIRISDLTERWRYEDMVRQLRIPHTNAGTDPSVAVFLQDIQGQFVQVNETAVEMLGYTLEDLRGAPWTTIVPKDQRYKVGQASLHRMRGESARYEIQLLHKSGKRLDVLVSESPYHEHGRYAGTFVFITDLTSLRKTEAVVLRQNWELQRVIDRFITQSQNPVNSPYTVDLQELLGQIGDELHQLTITCLVATFDPNEPYWKIQFATHQLQSKESEGSIQETDLSSPIRVNFRDPSLVLLQSGETIFMEEPDRSIESLVSQLTPFNPFLGGEVTCPRILAPLRTIDRLFGVLLICSEDLTAEDIPTITTFANHLSIALEKSRLLANTLKQAKLGQVLAEILSLSGQEIDIADLLECTGKLILETVHLKSCTFWLMEENADSLDVLLSATSSQNQEFPPIPVPGTTIKLEDLPIVKGALRTGRLAVLPEGCQLFADEGDLANMEGTFPTLLLPMMASDRAIGMASFPLENPESQLSSDELLFLQTSMDQLSLAVEVRKRAVREELRVRRDHECSVFITQILSGRDLDEVVQSATKNIANLFSCHFACLMSVDPITKAAQVLDVFGEKKTPLKVGEWIALAQWDGIDSLMDGKVIHYQVGNSNQAAASAPDHLLDSNSKSGLSIPLQDEGEVVWVLSIASKEIDLATPENLDIAYRIQEHLSTALANASARTKTEREAKDMAGLVELALAISEELDFRTLMHTAIRLSAQILDVTMGAVFLVDRSLDEISLVVETGLPTPPSVLRLQIGQGLAGKVWDKKGAIILNKSRDIGDPNWLEACYATGSAIGVPILWENEVRGVLTMYCPGEENRFNLHDIDILSKVAAQVSVRMENVEELDKTLRRVNQLRVINDIARRVSTILVEELLFTEIVRRTAHGLNLDLVILFLIEGDKINESASYYLPQDMYGIWEPISLRIGEGGIIDWVAGEGQPVLIPDISSDPSFLPVIPVDYKIQSVVGIPLKLKGQVTGILLAGSEKLGAFDKADIDALLTLGAHISTCIENARLYEETKVVQHRLAESEKLRAIGLVTGGIAHDFNNVLSVVLSRAELALMQSDDEEVHRHLEQVVAAAKEGGETVHRLEGFASYEKDKTDFIGVDINQIVQDSIEICKPRWRDQAQKGGIDLEIITELEANQLILGVPSELREVMINLIFNALDAIPAGGNINIKTKNKDNGVSLIIADDGVGMTFDMKQQAFVPFYTTKPGRVGLGLSMCYGILQRHGGTIDIHSELGEGTTVSIWLPIYAKSGSEEDSPQNNPVPALVEPATILVVEDEKSILDGLIETFADAGHKVLSASNGLEAFERFLEAGNLDIVFTDLGMPKLSGWELIEQLRAFDPKLPIVIFTGWGDIINPIKLRQYGIAKVIRKPFEMAKLHYALYEVLSMRRKLDPS